MRASHRPLEVVRSGAEVTAETLLAASEVVDRIIGIAPAHTRVATAILGAQGGTFCGIVSRKVGLSKDTFKGIELLQLEPGAINTISDAAKGAVQKVQNDPAGIDGLVVQKQLGLARYWR